MDQKQIILNRVTYATKYTSISAQRLARMTDITSKWDLSQPKVRSLILELIEEGHPIASCGKGYFFLQTVDEYNAYVDNLKSRINGIKKRIRFIDKAFNKRRSKHEKSKKLSGTNAIR